MAEDAGLGAPINFTLSRHEVLVTLNALEAEVIPGLGPDPLGELTPDQNRLALAIAQRAMLAHGFIQIQDAGLVFHQWLLNAVGTCAFAPKALMILQRTSGNNPQQYFVHLNDDVIAMHTWDGGFLHTFSLLPSRDYLIHSVIDITGGSDVMCEECGSFTLPTETFITIREYAERGDVSVAQELMDAGESSESWAFAETLSHSPRLTVFQFLHAKEDGDVEQKDFSLLNDDARAWLLETADDLIRIQPTSVFEFQTFLEQLL